MPTKALNLMVAGFVLVGIDLLAACRPVPAPTARPSAASLPVASSTGIGEELLPDLGTLGSGQDWPRLLGPSGDGKSTEKDILMDWPPSGPPILWTKTVGRGYSQVAVASGRLFIFDRQGDQARLRCLKSETGELLWSSEYTSGYSGYIEERGGPMATPVVDGGRVYTFGAEGRLRCQRVADGSLLWEVDTVERFGVVQNIYGAGSTPWVEGDLLIAMIGGSPPNSPGVYSERVEGNGTGIVAFDKHSGEIRYQITNELASYSSPLVVSHQGRRWGFAFTRGGLLAFEPTAGAVDFFFPWKDPRSRGVNAISPVVVGDTVFVSEAYGPGGVLLRFRPGGYDVLWRDPAGRGKNMASHWGTPIYHQGYLYGPSGRTSEEVELRCVKHATGEVMWRQPNLKLVTLLYVDGHFIVVTEFGRLLVIKASPDGFTPVADVNLFEPTPKYPWSLPVLPKGGPEVQRPLLRYPVWNAPVLSHGLLYVRGWTRLVCFDLRRGARQTTGS